MLFQPPTLDAHELGVVRLLDDLRQQLSYAVSSRRWTGLLRRATFARAVRGSNSIEGYNVTVDDAVAAVEGEEPLDAQHEAWAAVTGYRTAMTYVLQLADDPHFEYSEGFVRSLHYIMLSYDLTRNPGRWRPGPIYVRNEATGERIYQAPDAEHLPALMTELVESLTEESQVAVMVRAAMAHLNLVMIHPFLDGNGRMGRALQTLVLAREGILSPHFCSIEEYLGRNTEAYYHVLAEVAAGSWHPEHNARPWVRFCLKAHYQQASTLLRRSRIIQRLWDILEVEVRRLRLPERTIYALVDAAFGYRVRNATYRAVAEVSENLASRDLKLLTDQGLLEAKGEKRGRFYVASHVLKGIRQEADEPRRSADPFAEVAYLPGLLP